LKLGAGLRRSVRRLVNRWTRRDVTVWYHPTYRVPLAQSVGPPMDPKRADDALTWAVHAGLVAVSDVRSPEELSFTDAARVHTSQWLDAIDQVEVVARVLGTDPERIPVAALMETWRRAAGATRGAALEVVAKRGRAVNLLGGFHHAEPDRGGGFCAINDVAVAVACLRAEGFDGPVVVLDLDAHPPDGIVACLGSDPRVTVASISTASHWTVPPAERARVLDVRLPAGTGDLGYHAVLHDLLRQVKAEGVVFYLAGADPLRGDRLGGLDTTVDGLATRDERVFDWLDDTPVVALPAGGYSSDAWRVVAHTLAAAAGVSTRVDPEFDPLRHRTRAVASTLNPAQLGGHDDDVLITEEELLGGMRTATASEPRFLGYYTRHGLEHALTAYQYLPTLERMGFRSLEVDIQSGGLGPDRMVVSALVDGARATLIDLAASIRPIGAYRTLFAEWLELRDPRVSFSPDKPRLPGQKLPGLGLAEETMQLLVAAADRLGLAGVSFIPAHYHVAWISRDRFTVWDPIARGRFEALAIHTARQPLSVVSERLGTTGWPTEDGESIRWVPVEMVTPLDPALAAELVAGEPAASAAREALLDQLA
jgi:acetoin utilization deacetylase AcuC-like enzyme